MRNACDKRESKANVEVRANPFLNTSKSAGSLAYQKAEQNTQSNAVQGKMQQGRFKRKQPNIQIKMKGVVVTFVHDAQMEQRLKILKTISTFWNQE